MAPMLASQRRNTILTTVEQHGAVSITELAQELGVSAMTVRRDLDELDKQGLLQRTHGGAMHVPPVESDPPFTQREHLHQPMKQVIAAWAAKQVHPNDHLILDSGSTVATLAPYLAEKNNITVVTYSLPVMMSLSHTTNAHLICTGGTLDPSIEAFTGPLAESVLSNVRVNKAFIGATSVGIEDGFSNSHLQNRSLQQIILRVARECYLLVDSSKFARAPFWLVAQLHTLTAIITDDGVPRDFITRAQSAGIQVIVV